MSNPISVPKKSQIDTKNVWNLIFPKYKHEQTKKVQNITKKSQIDTKKLWKSLKSNLIKSKK